MLSGAIESVRRWAIVSAIMNPLAIGRLSAVLRLGIGVGLVAAPRMLTRAWIGADSGHAGPQAVARGLGIRDVALGAGLLAAADTGERRRWLLGALLADATDLSATLAAGDRLPLRGRVLVSAAAAGGVAMGAVALAGLGRS